MTAIVPHMSMVWHSLPSAHVPVGHVLPSLHNPSSPTVAETSAKVASGLVAQMVAGVGSLGRQMSAEQISLDGKLSTILSSLSEGDAMDTYCDVEEGHGLEVYRQLARGCDPQVKGTTRTKRIHIGERPVMWWCGSARAPDLPVATFFFWRWYGIASKYKKI